MKNNKGFTLIEMLTVVLIIGILTAVAVPQYSRAIKKARATEAMAMLRVIHDSGERLATEFGYRSFKSFSDSQSPDKAKATFQRLDMFDQDTIACTFSDTTTMVCDHYTYYLNKGNDYIIAKKNNDDKHTEFYLKRSDIPELSCYSDDEDLCDMYNLQYVDKKGQ